MFEDVCQYIPLAFSGNTAASVVCYFRKSYYEGGIFFCTADERRAILRTNFRGNMEVQKFMEMVAYLFELGYDLALSPSDNVLRSPGFKGYGLMKQQQLVG